MDEYGGAVFRNLSEDRLKHGVFKSVDELICAIDLFVLVHNEDPKPFIWTASTRDILEKVIRSKAKLNSVPSAGNTTLESPHLSGYSPL